MFRRWCEYRGESLTHHANQMKFFNAIAASAIIGYSFLAVNPAEARNGWVKVGTGTSARETLYIRPTGCRGSICMGQAQWSDGAMYAREINCVTWYARSAGRNWQPIMPGSMAEGEANIVCH